MAAMCASTCIHGHAVDCVLCCVVLWLCCVPTCSVIVHDDCFNLQSVLQLNQQLRSACTLLTLQHLQPSPSGTAGCSECAEKHRTQEWSRQAATSTAYF